MSLIEYKARQERERAAEAVRAADEKAANAMLEKQKAIEERMAAEEVKKEAVAEKADAQKMTHDAINEQRKAADVTIKAELDYQKAKVAEQKAIDRQKEAIAAERRAADEKTAAEEKIRKANDKIAEATTAEKNKDKAIAVADAAKKRADDADQYAMSRQNEADKAVNDWVDRLNNACNKIKYDDAREVDQQISDWIEQGDEIIAKTKDANIFSKLINGDEITIKLPALQKLNKMLKSLKSMRDQYFEINKMCDDVRDHVRRSVKLPSSYNEQLQKLKNERDAALNDAATARDKAALERQKAEKADRRADKAEHRAEKVEVDAEKAIRALSDATDAIDNKLSNVIKNLTLASLKYHIPPKRIIDIMRQQHPEAGSGFGILEIAMEILSDAKPLPPIYIAKDDSDPMSWDHGQPLTRDDIEHEMEVFAH